MSEGMDLIAIGKIERPFGVRGEVRVHSLSDVPGRFEGLKEVTVVSPSGQALDTVVTRVRGVNRAYLLGLEAITTPEDAARFRGGFIKIRQDQVSPLPPDRFFEFDLIGLTVVDESGTVLGRLEDILVTPAHHVFVIQGEKGEYLIPALKEFITRVDLTSRTMTVAWEHIQMEAADAV